MGIDVSKFHLANVVDTCAVWNILSSRVLFSRAIGRSCTFCITDYVHYECLVRPWKRKLIYETVLKSRLVSARVTEQFKSYSIRLEDLLDAEVLSNRSNLGRGELSTFA